MCRNSNNKHMKKIFYLLFLLLVPTPFYGKDDLKIVIIREESHETRSIVSLDYLEVINNELYVCSENNTSGTCYYAVLREGTVMMNGQVLLSAYSQIELEVKSLPIGSYIIEVKTPSNFISRKMEISEHLILRY